MKTIVCKKVEYIPVVHVQSINNNAVTLIPNKTFATVKTEKAEYVIEINSDDAGNSYQHRLNLSFYDDKSVVKSFKNYRLMVFRLTADDGTIYIIGRQKYPARLQSIIENTNEIRASFISSLPQFIEMQ